ncbi:hypothetical protein C1I99_29930, partial [Micromonospora deserti]
MTTPPQPSTGHKRQILIAAAAAVAVIAIAAGAYAAGRASSEPTPVAATPGPKYTKVAIGYLCENTNASAVGDDGRTLTCVYNQGKATWQLPTPSPSPST